MFFILEIMSTSTSGFVGQSSTTQSSQSCTQPQNATSYIFAGQNLISIA